MKRIVIDAREFSTTSGRYVRELLGSLQKIDHGHEYVVLLTPKDFPTWVPTNPHFKKIVCPHKEFTFAEQLGLNKQIKNIEADLVHFPFVQQPILYRGRTVTTMQDLTATRFRNPSKNWLVFTIKQQIYKFVNWYVARKTKWLIAPSKFVKEDVANFAGISEGKITVTYEAAAPLPRPAAPLPHLQNKKFIMYIGRPQSHKNLWRLIEAFRLLRSSHPDLYLALAGKKDALYDMIADRVKREGIEKVVFTSYVTDNELLWMYQNCQAYAFPSLSEGFGLPALEAMACGAPVVSSNATCSPEIYGEAAHYFDPLDVQDMATKISDVLDDPELRKKLIERGHKQAAKYSWQRMAEQTLAVYEKALKD